MTDIAATPDAAGALPRGPLVLSPAQIRKRYRAERRFRFYGQIAIGLALLMLGILTVTIVGKGWSAFYTYELELAVALDEAVIDPDGTRDPATLSGANYKKVVDTALAALFPDVSGRNDTRELNALMSDGARYAVRQMVLDDPNLIGQTVTIAVPLADDAIQVLKGNAPRPRPGDTLTRVSEQQMGWLDSLEERGLIESAADWGFFTTADSRKPELAGIWSAVVGSLYTMLVTLVLAFPIAVAAAIYLEEFAPKNLWTDLIEININNLAAVPSIVFGLLGLAVFLNVFGLPRSAPVAGGMVLALMTLPTIIIATRAALKAVPPSIREGALGMGASHQQAIQHHVLPLAMPGILTGTIIGMAQALGETAPLIMIGMVAFIASVPADPLSPATVLPVQIFIWSDSPERGFVEKTSAAIMVLLAFLVLMNGVAIYLRKKFERRW
ncbi:MAG: phosphate ABC transporter permease PstA [Alphaproteobacteria bacterium]